MLRLPILLHVKDALKSFNLMTPARLSPLISGKQEVFITCAKAPGSQLAQYSQVSGSKRK